MKKTITFLAVISMCLSPYSARAAYHFSDYRGKPPIHVSSATTKAPLGVTPDQIKKAYGLPSSGGSGTIAIIGAYDDASIEQDLQTFSKAFNLPVCTVASGCLERHAMASKMSPNSDWALETSLDVEWAHAIAPNAKILLIEAPTPSGNNLLAAVDFAARRQDVVSISMSWGGSEFPEETSLDGHFISVSGAPFFASSGDSGTGASWPASSPNVIGVGGTSLALSTKGVFVKETGWKGSGGGLSAYEKEPAFQAAYDIPKANGKRAVPDVAYDADPATGFPIVHSGKWRVAGGTSVGAPQWAAIAALGKKLLTPSKLYQDKNTSDATRYFRDITSGSNGTCTYFCMARAHYDYLTGLGTPQTAQF